MLSWQWTENNHATGILSGRIGNLNTPTFV